MNIYNTTALLGIIAGLDRPSSFLLDLYFPTTKEFTSEDVKFDKLGTSRRLAPFVSPRVAGKPMRQRGYRTESFTPAYVKPKHIVEPEQAFKRSAGERIGGGEKSPEERFNDAVAQNLADEDDMITRREEWMASELLRTGAMTVEGEDFPEMEVDLGRNAALTKVLTGASRWGETGISPLDNLTDWAAEVASISGVNPRVVTLDPLAAKFLRKDEEFRDILDNRRQASGSAELSGLVSGAQGEEHVFLGAVGNFEFWQYQAIYEDESGAMQKFMPDYTVILGAPTKAEGVRAYGAIKDTKARLHAMARFPKMWDKEDPSVTFTMTQSAPLPLLGRPDATMAATVR